MLDRLEKDHKHLKTICQGIMRKLGEKNVYVKPAEKQTILHIREIDAIATKTDIEEAIAPALQESQTRDAIQVTNVRLPSCDGEDN